VPHPLVNKSGRRKVSCSWNQVCNAVGAGIVTLHREKKGLRLCVRSKEIDGVTLPLYVWVAWWPSYAWPREVWPKWVGRLPSLAECSRGLPVAPVVSRPAFVQPRHPVF